jgi:two-component system LytT family response regulator
MEDFFFFKTGNSHFKIDTDAILYIHSDKRYVTFVTQAQCYPALISISYVEKLLSPKLFCRVHRSYIISLKHTDKFDHELIYIGNKKIPLAERYRNALKKAITVINGNRGPITSNGDDIDKLLNDLNC